MTGVFDSIDSLLMLVEGASLWTVFFTLVAGLIFAPVNREVIVILMALVAASGAISPLSTYIILTCATFVAYIIGFFISRFFRHSIFADPSPKMKENIERSYRLIDKYGTMAIIISYFIPGVRLVTPVILGVSAMPWTKFVIASKAASLIWISFIYIPTYFLGDIWGFLS